VCGDRRVDADQRKGKRRFELNGINAGFGFSHIYSVEDQREFG
jgi:hypothetical protein